MISTRKEYLAHLKKAFESTQGVQLTWCRKCLLPEARHVQRSCLLSAARYTPARLEDLE
jgi:hypothetical protein